MCHLQHPRGLERLFLWKEMFSNLLFLFFWSVWTLSCFCLQKLNPAYLRGRLFSALVSVCSVPPEGITECSAGACLSPLCRWGNWGTLRHLQFSQIPGQAWTTSKRFPQQVSRAGRAQAAGWAGAVCPRGAGTPAVTSLCWHAVLGSRSDASREPEPQHPTWPLSSYLLFLVITMTVPGPGDVEVRLKWGGGNLSFS